MARTGEKALVLGGSGAVGREVVRALVAAGLDVAFTFRTAAARAAELAGETGARALPIDLREPAAIRAACAEHPASVLIHAAVASRAVGLADATDDDWADAHAVNLRAPFVACQALAPTLRAARGAIVLVGALDRAQSIPSPPHFASSQGGLGALVMALAKELGGDGVCANLVAVGLLDDGLSRQLDPALVADYRKFSALRRLGTPAEVARAVAWLATENTYMNGKVLPVNGGI